MYIQANITNLFVTNNLENIDLFIVKFNQFYKIIISLYNQQILES